MVGVHPGRLAAIVLLVAACSGALITPAPDGVGSTPGPTEPVAPIDAPTVAPTGTPRTGPTPTPALDLPNVIDVRTTTATVIKATPSPDFIVLAGVYAFASGVGNGVGRFDLATGDLVGSIAIPGDSCEALDAGFGAAWTATCDGPGLARIDAATGAVSTVELGGRIPDSEASVGAGEGAVWVIVDGSPRTLVKVDPASMTMVGAFEIPGTPTAVRAGLGAAWVADPALDVVHRVDPASGLIVATIPVGRQPQFLAIGEGSVWTMDQVDGTVSRVDPGTNTVIATIELGEVVRGGDIAVGGGSVWLRGSRTLLFRIDPATNEIVERYGPSAGSGSVAADEDAVWITAHDITTIWRLEYSRLVE
ncbi:MAG TPA: hypothetical protein VLS28_04945 [Candidatus Sulfomarinibacteraceae bacterium]|nr:hypothetical protein [Candidatus Sulfomarinibacteraceae bacterium]